MESFNKATKNPSRCIIIIWIISAFILAISFFLWIGFHPLFKAIVHSQLKLSQEEDGQLTKTTFLWSKPPIKNLMQFYVYNVTNVDAVTFFGEKPSLVEVGPFGVWAMSGKIRFNAMCSKNFTHIFPLKKYEKK